MMHRSFGLSSTMLALALVIVVSSPAAAEETDPSLVLVERQEDPLVIERVVDADVLLSAVSNLAALTIERFDRANQGLRDFTGLLRSLRVRHRAAAATVLEINRLVVDQVWSADELRADYSQSLNRLEKEDRLRLEKEAIALRNMSAVVRIVTTDDWVCPVEGTVKFYDSWLEVRSGGKLHMGVDIIGFRGARLRAPVDGRVTFYWDTVGGRSFNLYADNGDYYFGTHLLRFGSPGRVKAGDPIGQLGAGGNATGNHLHFEYHPGGRGNDVNPYPIVDVHCDNRLPIDVPLDHYER